METGLNVSEPIGCSVEAVATMIGCFPTQALTFNPVSIQMQRTQTHATQAIAFGWKPGFRDEPYDGFK